VAAGRLSWALFAHGLGIPPGAITPIRPVLLMTFAAIVIANAVAFWPGRNLTAEPSGGTASRIARSGSGQITAETATGQL